MAARDLTPAAAWPPIDWDQPWLAPWRGVGQPVWECWRRRGPAPGALAEALNASGLAPVRFVPQSALPDGVAYESFVHDSGCVPTRDLLHDFFNALCWLRFPRAKAALNRLQATAIRDQGGVQPVRGPLRDALTLFDENALLLQAPESVWAPLQARQWADVFVQQRAAWAVSCPLTWGHALTEKLLSPYKSITAHVWLVPVPAHLPADAAQGPHPWDAWMAPLLTAEQLVHKPFTPLPVLGIPGWCSDNHDPAFYADTTVFRPGLKSVRQPPSDRVQSR